MMPNPSVRLVVVNVSEINPELVTEYVISPPPSIASDPLVPVFFFLNVTNCLSISDV